MPRIVTADLSYAVPDNPEGSLSERLPGFSRLVQLLGLLYQ